MVCEMWTSGAFEKIILCLVNWKERTINAHLVTVIVLCGGHLIVYDTVIEGI